MTGPSSGEATAATPGEEVQPREAFDADTLDLAPNGDALTLDWQSELDSALESIESALPVKRRRSTDPSGTPPFPRPELSMLTFTPEILDALAARVADRLKAADQPAMPPAAEPTRMKAGAVLSIRFKWPLFSLPFTRRGRRAKARW